MSDKIEQSLKSIVDKNSKILEIIEKRLDAAGLKAAQSAAAWSSHLLRALSSNDNVLNGVMSKMSKWGGLSGKKAATAFTAAWKGGLEQTKDATRKVQSAIADVDRRMQRLAERQTVGWSKAAGVQKQIMLIAKQIDMNKRLMKSVAYQQKNASTPEEAQALQFKYEQLNRINKSLEKQGELTKKLGVQTRQLEVEEFIQDQKEKYFGWYDKLKSGVNNGIDGASHAFSGKNFKTVGLKAALVGIGAALMIMIDEAMEAGKVFRESGQFASQLAKSVGSTAEVSRDMMKRGLVIPTKEAAEAVNALQGSLGELYVPRELATETAYIAKMFKLSSQEAAELTSTLFRFSGRNIQQTQSTLKYVAAFANKNGLNTQAIMRDMAQHAEDFAKAGNMSARAFTRAAADAQRIGYSMSSITGLADRLVGDFEGALRSQAELSTMFPGMDMTEVTYASQFGTNEDIAEAVKSMINTSGYDINALPRSFKSALQKNLGMSASEIANIYGSKDISKFADPAKQDELNMTEHMLTEAFDLKAGGLGEVIKVLRNILFALGPLGWLKSGSDALDARNARQKADKSKIYTNMGLTVTNTDNSKKLKASDLQFTRASVYHDGGIVGSRDKFKAIPKFHDGLLSNEMLAVLEKGEAVLTTQMQHGVSALVRGAKLGTSSVGASSTQSTDAVEVTSPVATPVDVTKMEKLLSEIVVLLKAGQVIEMDGKKVGQTITAAFSRS